MPASMHNPAADLLAKVVVDLRKKAGMNQRELAATLGREQNYVARIETGQWRLDLIEWVQVLRALGVEEELAHTSIRFGLGRFTTQEEVDYVIELVVNKVNKLRALSPLYEMAREGIDLKSIEWAAH